LSQLLLDHLLGTLRKWREARTVRQKTTRQEDVSKATVRRLKWVRGIEDSGMTLYSPEVFSECLHSIHDWLFGNFRILRKRE
jgi:hypothetical protein